MEREAELEEALAKAAPPHDAGERAAAAEARAYAARLRGQTAPDQAVSGQPLAAVG